MKKPFRGVLGVKENEPPASSLVRAPTNRDPGKKGQTLLTGRTRGAASHSNVPSHAPLNPLKEVHLGSDNMQESCGDSCSPVASKSRARSMSGMSERAGTSQRGAPPQVLAAEHACNSVMGRAAEKRVVASVVRKLETATGTGCDAVLGLESQGRRGGRDVWTTR
jgi:hypothetical protein